MLHIHRAERADALAGALADILVEPLEDPFAPEIISVPTRGVERWLAQRLSHRLGAGEGCSDGVCANIEFPFPGTLVGEALAAATGLDLDDDPWSTARSTWPLIQFVEECRDESWLAPLSGYLGHAEPHGERPGHDRPVAAIRQIADLFDHYSVHRPEMVRAWAHEQDVDDVGEPLDPEYLWEPLLWRGLRAKIGEPSPAERLEQACSRIRESAEVLRWPKRISVFLLTHLAGSYLQVLRAVAARRDVHLFVLHPSPALWDTVAADLGSSSPAVRRDSDATAKLAANRVLASWGRDARELQLVLARSGQSTVHHHPAAAAPAMLLGRLQADIRENREPPGEPVPGAADERPMLDLDDRSVQIHSCHGRARQVEVVRDAILHLLQGDETLEPRDVIVMCPDVETFAPLIQATFGADHATTGDEDGELPPDVRPADLRVRLADRSLRQTNPVLAVVAHVLELADSRVTASQILSLADRDPVRRRFGLDDDELGRIEDWVVSSGIHWGLDAASRAPFKLDKVPDGTWRAGLDRVLLGIAMTEQPLRLFGSVLPLDDVDSGEIELAGRFAEYVGRVEAALGTMSRRQSLDKWCEAISAVAQALTLTPPWETWQSRELELVLDELQSTASAEGHRFDAPVTLADVRGLLADRLRGRATRANFRTGNLTICTLYPMRSVPHRVICLLGLDDAAFPRRSPHDGDDLCLRNPHVGDGNPRTEDRQMLLDALMAATQHLVVTYAGNDERTNTPRPPAVPVGELLDAIDRTVRTSDGRAARDHVVFKHPLQPFDPRNFSPGALIPEGAWSYDRMALNGAVALTGPRSEPPAFIEEPLPPVDDKAIELAGLIDCIDRPVRAFLRRRLKIYLGVSADQVSDRLPVELNHLERYSVGQRLLEARLDGLDWHQCKDIEIARGELPPQRLGGRVVVEMYTTIDALVSKAEELRAGLGPVSRQVHVTLADGRPLTGTVPGIFGTRIQNVSYARIGAQHRLTAWVRLLALTAAYPDQQWHTATLGRAPANVGTLALCEISALEAVEDRAALALSLLAPLVDIRERALRGPLPLFRKTSAAYAEAVHMARGWWRATNTAWTGPYPYPGENAEPEHLEVFGDALSLDEVLAEPPEPDEVGPGWNSAEDTRFGRYARRLWGELLARETRTQW